MNKVIFGLILSVCVLGMALIMLNEHMHKEPAPVTAQESASREGEAPLPPFATPQGAPAPTAAVTDAERNAPPDVLPEPIPAPEKKKPEMTPPRPAPQDINTVAKVEQDMRRQNQPAAPADTAPAKQEKPAAAATAPEKKEAHNQQKESAQKENPKKESRQQPAEQEKKQPSPPRVTKFVVFARDKGATVRIVGSQAMSYSTMQLHNPERLVVDIPGKWDIKAPGVPANAAVSNIRLGKEKDKTRIVIDLKGKMRFSVSQPKERKGLDVRFDQ
ncbi:MAG: AMIN domain-containing protein [Desulfovibrio sp.]|nr:AMIN domain-containing protein [Desulfovibrio sp.]